MDASTPPDMSLPDPSQRDAGVPVAGPHDAGPHAGSHDAEPGGCAGCRDFGGVSRRALLGAGALGVGAFALAACGSSSPSTSRSPSTAGARSDSGGVQALAALSSIQVGQSASAQLPSGQPVIVTRTGQSSVVCHTAICTHAGCTVAPSGSHLVCPCHGSVYDPRTGKVLNGPAPLPLAAIAVKVVGGQVLPASGNTG